MIDEYQDTNRSQYELMRLLSADARQRLRGGRRRSVHLQLARRGHPQYSRFRARLSQRDDVIRLEQNYRSTKNILEAASAVVANNKERKGKWLWTEADGRRHDRSCTPDPTPRTKRCSSPIPSRSSSIANPEDRVAVLYRTNSQSRQIEEALRRYGRKYNVVGGFSFYQRAEIKDVRRVSEVAAPAAGFDQPAAHHQHAGARHRAHHGGADREIRARTGLELCGRHRAEIDRNRFAGAVDPLCDAVAIGAA